MADRLTQLQDCYDQLATQFYACIRYISLHHSSSPLPVEARPPQDAQRSFSPNHQQPIVHHHEQPDASTYPSEQRPDSPNVFTAAQRELAQDLLIKTKQIEHIISVLPGVENSQESQVGRIKELELEFRSAAKERKNAEEERKASLTKIEEIILNVRR